MLITLKRRFESVRNTKIRFRDLREKLPLLKTEYRDPNAFVRAQRLEHTNPVTVEVVGSNPAGGFVRW